MKLTPDQLEYAISQYIDGNLPAIELAALEERLATDAEARALLEEYRALDATVRRNAPRVPNLDWDRVSANLIDAVAREAAPVRNFALPWVRNAQRIAVAASLVIVFGVGMLSYRARSVSTVAPTSLARVEVTGPQIETHPQTPVIQVAIGPSPAAESSWRYADSGIVSRPAVVLIDRAFAPAQDSDAMPF